MIGWMLERLSQNPTAVFSERELLDQDADAFTDFAENRLLTRLPLDYAAPTVVYRGRVLSVNGGPQDAVIEAFDEEDVDFEPIRLSLAHLSRWQLDLHAWATEFAARHDAVGGPRQLDDRAWWIGRAHERVSLQLLLPRRDDDVRDLLQRRPAEPGVRQAVLLPPHIGRGIALGEQQHPLITWLTPDGFATNPALGDALMAPPKDGYIEPIPGFRHSPDFRSVNRRGTLISLTTQQARVIEVLLDAFLNRAPDVSQAFILEELEVAGSALRFIFRDSEAWNTLVVPGGTNGTFRLEP